METSKWKEHRNGVNLAHLNNNAFVHTPEFMGLLARRVVAKRVGMEFGVELIALVDCGELEYVNRGDTYDETLVSIDGGDWFWSSWGDEYEKAERRHEEDTGERRCPYCSDWSDVQTCGGCGNLVWEV